MGWEITWMKTLKQRRRRSLFRRIVPLIVDQTESETTTTGYSSYKTHFVFLLLLLFTCWADKLWPRMWSSWWQCWEFAAPIESTVHDRVHDVPLRGRLCATFEKIPCNVNSLHVAWSSPLHGDTTHRKPPSCWWLRLSCSPWLGSCHPMDNPSATPAIVAESLSGTHKGQTLGWSQKYQNTRT